MPCSDAGESAQNAAKVPKIVSARPYSMVSDRGNNVIRRLELGGGGVAAGGGGGGGAEAGL
jgi:hypothetical protein